MLDRVLERAVDRTDQVGGEWARPRPLAPQDERELERSRPGRPPDRRPPPLAREPLAHEALQNVEGDLPQGGPAVLHRTLLEDRGGRREVLAVPPQARDHVAERDRESEER